MTAIKEHEATKPEQPNQKHFEDILQKLREKIRELKDEEKKEQEKIEKKSEGRTGFEEERTQAQSAFNDTKSAHNSLKNELYELFDKQKLLKSQQRAARMEQNELKRQGSGGVSNLVELEQRLNELEMRMQTGTMSLKDEK